MGHALKKFKEAGYRDSISGARGTAGLQLMITL